MSRLVAVCGVPYLFLAMLIEWRCCPTGLLSLELLIFLIPVGLSWRAGKRGTKKEALLGAVLQGLVSGAFVAALSLADVPLNRCGNVWGTYFKPFSAWELFVLLEGLLLLLQWGAYHCGKPKRF